MRNVGVIAILGWCLSVGAAQATTIVHLEPSPDVVSQTTLYEDVAAFATAFTTEDGRFEPNGPRGLVPRAHATEPGTLVLLGTGLLGVATLLRRRVS